MYSIQQKGQEMDSTTFTFSGIKDSHPLKNEEGTDMDLDTFLKVLGGRIYMENLNGELPFITIWTSSGHKNYRVHQ